MKINNINTSQTSFKKSLAANVSVLKDNKPFPCKIYQLEKADVDYFKNLSKTQRDRFPNYLSEVSNVFDFFTDEKYCSDGTDFFVLEDEKNECLGIMETFEPRNVPVKNIEFIEVAYDCAGERKKRNTKYIGETMLSFIGKLIKKDNYKKIFYIESPVRDAQSFYIDKCGFEECQSMGSMTAQLSLPEEKIDKLIAQNEEHTKGKIELVG